MNPEIKKKIKRRLAVVSGQIKGVQEMVEEEKYCVDIITQIEAAREALAGAGSLILKNHLETHVSHEMKYGQESKATEEILKIYKLARK